jgi:predicted lipoprotein with Yx(FWY)xxD motif
MRTVLLLLVIAAVAVAVAGCGDDDSDTAGSPGDSAAKNDAPAAKEDMAAAKKDDSASKQSGPMITLRDSNFGPMLFDAKHQAIYVFERDSRNKTVCYGECAEAWPPVFSEGPPRVGKGVRASLLGTIKRRDGRAQVTYAGKPLYFYAHEDPGVVLCHNVNLNGGFWWAIGADGSPRPT